MAGQLQAEIRIALTGLTRSELEAFLRSIGQPAYRADQVWQWLYRDLAGNFESMTNLPKELRHQLSETAAISSLEPVTNEESQNAQTTKVLFRLRDGQHIESVLMLYEGRRSVCVSTQVGCAMGCAICATGQSGLVRQLEASEIVDQVLHFGRLLNERSEEITNVVFMGMGEPLANMEALLRSIDILHDPDGFNLGARRMTVSTVGLAPQIRRFADWELPVNLAVSLHAPSDDLRNKLSPVTVRYSLKDLLAACRYYVEKTGRRVTFEYVMLDGVNDSSREARQLAQLLRGLLSHVNLIPASPVEGANYRPSSKERIVAFQAELEKAGVPATVRVARGTDIQAACGQLRQSVIGSKVEPTRPGKAAKK